VVLRACVSAGSERKRKQRNECNEDAPHNWMYVRGRRKSPTTEAAGASPGPVCGMSPERARSGLTDRGQSEPIQGVLRLGARS
jgi:hypothetical protein